MRTEASDLVKVIWSENKTESPRESSFSEYLVIGVEEGNWLPY